MRLPQRERLRLVDRRAGRGAGGQRRGLRAALRRANPALQQADKVVAVLASQDQLLARLVDESDRVLEPWAARRRETAGFIETPAPRRSPRRNGAPPSSGTSRSCPRFLRELEPAAERFEAFAAQAARTRAACRRSAGDQRRGRALGPFARAATPALDCARRAAPSRPRDVPGGRAARERSARSGRRWRRWPRTSPRSSRASTAGGIEELMRLDLLLHGAINGVDRWATTSAAGSASACSEPCLRSRLGLRIGDLRPARRRSAPRPVARLPARAGRGGGRGEPQARSGRAVRQPGAGRRGRRCWSRSSRSSSRTTPTRGCRSSPAYALKADVPNASGLVRGQRGAHRRGPRRRRERDSTRSQENGTVSALLELELEPGSIRCRRTRRLVRPRSPLGLKYVEITSAGRARGLRGQGPTIPFEAWRRSRSRSTSLRHVRRAHTRRGAGTSLNDTEPRSPAAVTRSTAALARARAARDAARAGDAQPRSPALAVRAVCSRRSSRRRAEAGARGGPQATMWGRSTGTFASLAAVSESIQESIAGGPAGARSRRRASCPRSGRSSWRATVLFRRLRPAFDALAGAAPDLSAALARASRRSRRSPALTRRLDAHAELVEEFGGDPRVPRGLERLDRSASVLAPLAAFVAPAQTRCNYAGAVLRNRRERALRGRLGRHASCASTLAMPEARQRGGPVVGARERPGRRPAPRPASCP